MIYVTILELSWHSRNIYQEWWIKPIIQHDFLSCTSGFLHTRNTSNQLPGIRRISIRLPRLLFRIPCAPKVTKIKSRPEYLLRQRYADQRNLDGPQVAVTGGKHTLPWNRSEKTCDVFCEYTATTHLFRRRIVTHVPPYNPLTDALEGADWSIYCWPTTVRDPRGLLCPCNDPFCIGPVPQLFDGFKLLLPSLVNQLGYNVPCPQSHTSNTINPTLCSPSNYHANTEA